jgi:hypothetical protein
MEDKFALANARAPVFFCEQAAIGRIVQLEDQLQLLIVIGDTRKHGVEIRRVLGRQQPVGIEAAQIGEWKGNHD